MACDFQTATCLGLPVFLDEQVGKFKPQTHGVQAVIRSVCQYTPHFTFSLLYVDNIFASSCLPLLVADILFSNSMFFAEGVGFQGAQLSCWAGGLFFLLPQP